MQFDKNNPQEALFQNHQIMMPEKGALSFWRGLVSEPKSREALSHGHLEAPCFAQLDLTGVKQFIEFLDSTFLALEVSEVWETLVQLASTNSSELDTSISPTESAEEFIAAIPKYALEIYVTKAYSYLCRKYLDALHSTDSRLLNELSDDFEKIQSHLHRRLLFRNNEKSPFEALSTEHLSTFSYFQTKDLFAFTSFPQTTFPPNYYLSALLNFGTNISFWQEFNKNVPKIDLKGPLERIATIGAKASSLEALAPCIESLNQLTEHLSPKLTIPAFTPVPASLYQEYVHSGRLPIDALTKYYESTIIAKPADYLIRSSAVHSEDGQLLGAGKYLTVGLSAKASLDDFLKAVQMVYESVNSPEAVNYREEYGVTEQELMGLVIMELKQGEHNGYVNTMRNQMPHAIDVVKFTGGFYQEYDREGNCHLDDILYNYIGKSHPFVISRDSSLLNLPKLDSSSVKLLVQADMSRGQDLCFPSSAHDAAFVALMIERLVGEPIQMEYIYEQNELHIVQIRVLPAKWRQPCTIEFPESPAIAHTSSIGVCDQVLEVIDPYSADGELGQFEDDRISISKEGLLIMSGSYFGGNNRGWERLLPKRGAVLLLQQTGEFRGHIETSCLERGLTILQYSDRYDDYSTPLFMELGKYFDDPNIGRIFDRANYMMEPVPYVPKKKTFLRVVSNGIEARLYPADSQ